MTAACAKKPSVEQPNFPYYHLVPKDYSRNLRFRQMMLRHGSSNKQRGEELWIMCSRDILFYVNTFVWTEDPRLQGGVTVIPFITYEYQDELFGQLLGATGFIPGGVAHDLLIEKSRDMGATWASMIMCDWAWRFKPRALIEVASRKEGLVDKTDNPDTLFAKLDFIEEHLPPFIALGQARRRRQLLSLRNLANDSVISGESTTGNIGRGGRRRFILLDEFASFEEVKPGSGQEALRSTRDNTECRIMNSTPKGTATAFYNMRNNPSAEKATLHWSLHPKKRPGLYRIVQGQVRVLDAAWHDNNPGYHFQSAPGRWKGLRSAWYDAECIRAGSDIEIAQELDLDYFGAGDPFFDQRKIEEILERDVRQPLRACRASDLVPSLKLDEVYMTPLRIWCNMDGAGKPPQATAYSMGCDISTGTGASDSTISIVDQKSGEKVAEYVNNRVLAEDFASIAVALARLFSTPMSQCFMGWEATGPGEAFGVRVTTIHGYKHVYYYRSETDVKRKRAPRPGWYANKALKHQLLAGYRSALATGKFINRSKEAVEQCREYIYTQSGSIEHARQRVSESASGNREQHGDLVIADAVACKMLDEWQPIGLGSLEGEAPRGSLAERVQYAEQQANQERYW